MTLRSPVVHFVAAGALLFVLDASAAKWDWSVIPSPARYSTSADERAELILSEARVEQLVLDYAKFTGWEPTAVEESGLIENALDEEALYREALAARLDRDDRGIRNRLIEKMRFLEAPAGRRAEQLYREARALGLDRDDPVIRRLLVDKYRRLLGAGAGDVSERDLREFFQRNRTRYLRPERFTIWQVYLSADGHGERMSGDVRALRAKLEASTEEPSEAEVLGDPFPIGNNQASWSEAELANAFGDAFANSVAALAPGAWSAPIESAYGTHFVWLQSVREAELPVFDSVRYRVARDLAAENRSRLVARHLLALRAKYRVVVKNAPWTTVEKRALQVGY